MTLVTASVSFLFFSLFGCKWQRICCWSWNETSKSFLGPSVLKASRICFAFIWNTIKNICGSQNCITQTTTNSRFFLNFCFCFHTFILVVAFHFLSLVFKIQIWFDVFFPQTLCRMNRSTLHLLFSWKRTNTGVHDFRENEEENKAFICEQNIN